MIWRAKVTCQLQGRIVEKGEIVESPEQPNPHFEQVEEIFLGDADLNENPPVGDPPGNTNLNENLPPENPPGDANLGSGQENSEGGQTSLDLNPGNPENPQDPPKNISDSGDQLDEYNRLVDILQANKYSLSDLPDRRKTTITKFLQEKGLL